MLKNPKGHKRRANDHIWWPIFNIHVRRRRLVAGKRERNWHIRSLRIDLFDFTKIGHFGLLLKYPRDYKPRTIFRIHGHLRSLFAEKKKQSDMLKHRSLWFLQNWLQLKGKILIIRVNLNGFQWKKVNISLDIPWIRDLILQIYGEFRENPIAVVSSGKKMKPIFQFPACLLLFNFQLPKNHNAKSY